MAPEAQRASGLRAGAAVKRASVVDAEGYSSSVRGVDIHAVRTGSSREPNSVAAVSDDYLTITAAHIGFPISTTAHTPDNTVFVARIHSAPVGSRWVGKPLHADQVLLYGPGVEHFAVNPAGTSFTFVTTEIEHVERRADELQGPSVRLEPGAVDDVTAVTAFDAIARGLDPVGTLREGIVPPWILMDDLLSLIAVASGQLRQERPTRSRTRPDSGRVIRRCLDYASSTGRRPSIGELCLTAGVSERTLRDIFIAAFDLPPSIFFRHWALNRAFDRLASGDRFAGGVSDVALESGFGHFGRFAHYYKQVFGELPSETMRRSQPTRPRLVALGPRRRSDSPRRRSDWAPTRD